MIMISDEKTDESVFQKEPKYKPGQLVKHKRYHYRGVIVDFDTCCKADEGWYQKNQTQPNRNQPWYHVLVNNSTINTYAAETSLLEDDLTEPINHPLIDYFFSGFNNGVYERNGRPWGE